MERDSTMKYVQQGAEKSGLQGLHHQVCVFVCVFACACV